MYISAGNPGDLFSLRFAGTNRRAKSAAIETENELEVATGDGSTFKWNED